MGLQFSMQNMADLLKYVVTMILSRPSQFRWATLISFMAVFLGVVSYAVSILFAMSTFLRSTLTEFVSLGVRQTRKRSRLAS